MDEAAALKSIKGRLDIDAGVMDFDTILAEFLLDGVARLSPTVYNEIDPETVDVSPDSQGNATVLLSKLRIDDVRSVEIIDSAGIADADNIRVHSNTLFLREIPQDTTQVIIYGLAEYEIEDVPRYLHLPVYWYAMSEYFNFLLANKAKYNVYMQNGRSDVDNMQDLADYYEQKADEFMRDKGTPLGR